MFLQEMMHEENKTILDGTDLEIINDYLEQIDKSWRACDAIARTLHLINLPWKNSTESSDLKKEVQDFVENGLLMNNLICNLRLVSETLYSAEEDITAWISKKTEFHSKEQLI